jgi:hypothetical protein
MAYKNGFDVFCFPFRSHSIAIYKFWQGDKFLFISKIFKPSLPRLRRKNLNSAIAQWQFQHNTYGESHIRFNFI